MQLVHESLHADPRQGMAGLISMPMEALLTYQDLAAKLKCCTKTVARLLQKCPRFQPTPNTIRFLESDVCKFIREARSAKVDGKPDRKPEAKPEAVRRTKRPVSA
jgi:hypothetical protein